MERTLIQNQNMLLIQDRILEEDMPIIVEPLSTQSRIFSRSSRKSRHGGDVLHVKRIYDKASITDGKRILVDGLWPRGIRRSTANIDSWAKDVAPSKQLRHWFHKDPKRWAEFKKRYARELEKNKALGSLVSIVKNNDVTFLYSSSDEKHNNAIVLAEVVKKKLKEKSKEK